MEVRLPAQRAVRGPGAATSCTLKPVLLLMLLTKARNTPLMNSASWSITSASGNPAPDRRHMSQMITAASESVAVAVERVGTACTLPGSR